MKRRLSIHRLVHILLFATSVNLLGQSVGRLKPGKLDGDISIPSAMGTLGQLDPVAVAELKAHIVAVGHQDWVGMQGIGKIIYGGQDTTAYDATIYNLGVNKYRLDAQTMRGMESFRIDGQLGKVRGADGKLSLIPSDPASLAIFPFEIPRATAILTSQISLHDRGVVSVGGTELHRITYEVPGGSAALTPQTTAVDLYFDPSTHVLVKTASLVRLARSRPVFFLSVVTYSDYRKVDGILIPFRYTETLEGELSRTLQLSTVQLAPSLSSTDFDF